MPAMWGSRGNRIPPGSLNQCLTRKKNKPPLHQTHTKMKLKLLALVSAVGLLAHSALAQVTFTASPSTQTVNLSSTNLFNVTFTLTVTGGNPPSINGFDLFVETNTANNPNANSFFSITGATNLLPGSVVPSDTPTYPDTITTVGSDHTGFAQNAHSQGFSSDTNTSTTNPVPLETLSFSIAPNTPNGTYFFRTSNIASSTNKYSLVTDASFTAHPVNNDATFSISVVPEPTTWALLCLAGVGAFVVKRLQTRRNG